MMRGENARAEKSGNVDFRDSVGHSELMMHRVRDILLVSSMYDAFVLEEEGLLSDQISDEYRAMSLSSSPPTVTRVDNCALALETLEQKRYDMIISIPKFSDMDPFEFGSAAKIIQKGIPIILLLTDTADIPRYHRPGARGAVDKVFYWNGDSSLFFALTKYAEDLLNVESDTGRGFVRVLLIVEDSPKYYSMFLPIVYKEIMLQTHALISEGLNEHEKIFRKRARPKIVLAETYEEAVKLFDVYRDNILGVITDVKYLREGKEDGEAGFGFIQHIGGNVPVLVQSSKELHGQRAVEMGVKFTGKKSERLLQDLRSFFKDSLGFGDFVFRDIDGNVLGRARDLKEFIQMLEIVSVESIVFHANSNHFSNWLIARGEIGLALKLRPKRVSDFKTHEDVRYFLTSTFRELDRAKRRGVITDFEQQNFEMGETFTRLGGGSLGGKGRGLAFLYAMFAKMNIDSRIKGCRVRIPDTLVIGTDIFDRFMDDNNLRSIRFHEMSDDDIKKRFLEADIPGDIVQALERFTVLVKQPLAVRSSSLLEDSQNQPLAGIYATYMLPNNCQEGGKRLEQLCEAIRLIYASAFMGSARTYIQNTAHSIEEEKMAVVIQNMVGNRYGDRFYPIYSGVAQSYNFYPVAPMKREDGIVSIAMGLGKTIMDGEKTMSVSPRSGTATPGLFTTTEIVKNTQDHFYSLDMSDACHDISGGEDVTLLRLGISGADDDTLDYVASTYDPVDERIRDGTGREGPRVITFAGILKYGMLPLQEVVEPLLEFGNEGMGMPVEIEFAMMFDNAGKPEFNVLQIRPMLTVRNKNNVTITEPEQKEALARSSKALGNGILRGIRDVIFVDPDRFDRTRTLDIAAEIGKLNETLDRPYLLIGPGRWGTRDRFLGIPVEWMQISRARAMVEVGLEGFRIDPSHGTHFFHNITSLGIMYFTIPFGSTEDRLDWDWLRGDLPGTRLEFVTHVAFPYELELKVDGRTGLGVILKRNHEK